MPSAAKKITARRKKDGTIREWRTTGAIDDTSNPGFEKFNGRRIGTTPAESTDGDMWIDDSEFEDKKVEDAVAS